MSKLDTNLWKDEINSEVQLLKEMEAGTDEYKATVDGVTKLADRLIEVEKLELQKTAAERAHLSELSEQHFKHEQAAQEKKDRIISYIFKGVEIALPAAIGIWGTLKTIEFEKEGTVTTIFGREYFKKLFYKK